jgi:Eco57I restriction-modification methylase
MDDVSAKTYLRTYETTHKNYDIYVPFVERGVSMLNANGYFCYIMPNKFLHVEYGEKMRRYLSSNGYVRNIVNFGHNQIFSEEATTYTCLLFLTTKYQTSFHYIEVLPLQNMDEMEAVIVGESMNSKVRQGTYTTTQYGPSPWIFAIGNEAELLEKVKNECIPLTEVVDQIIVGLQTSVGDN